MLNTRAMSHQRRSAATSLPADVSDADPEARNADLVTAAVAPDTRVALAGAPFFDSYRLAARHRAHVPCAVGLRLALASASTAGPPATHVSPAVAATTTVVGLVDNLFDAAAGRGAGVPRAETRAAAGHGRAALLLTPVVLAEMAAPHEAGLDAARLAARVSLAHPPTRPPRRVAALRMGAEVGTTVCAARARLVAAVPVAAAVGLAITMRGRINAAFPVAVAVAYMQPGTLACVHGTLMVDAVVPPALRPEAAGCDAGVGLTEGPVGVARHGDGARTAAAVAGVVFAEPVRGAGTAWKLTQVPSTEPVSLDPLPRASRVGALVLIAETPLEPAAAVAAVRMPRSGDSTRGNDPMARAAGMPVAVLGVLDLPPPAVPAPLALVARAQPSSPAAPTAVTTPPVHAPRRRTLVPLAVQAV